MNAFHAFQALLFAGVVWVVVRNTRDLVYGAGRVEGRPFVAAVRGALRVGNLDRAQALADDAGDAWVGRVARQAFEAHRAHLDVSAMSEEVLLVLRYEAGRSPRQLRALASLASAGGLLGATGELLWLLGGSHGLKGLQAGLPEAIATNGALLSLGLGMGTAALALATRAGLAREGRVLFGDARRLADALARGLDAPGGD
ncbi:MAG: hypothetical protein AAF447_04385 [Myxococcota bacterium]